METKDKLLYLLVTVVGVCLFVWMAFMAKKHCSGKTPAEKCKSYEKMLMRPYLMVVLSFIVSFGLILITVVAFCDKEPFSEVWVVFVVLIAANIVLVLYSTRQIVIYTYDYMRHQPAIGKMRTYNFADVKFMQPILFDLLICVDKRLILLDFQQGWMPLVENYRLWQKQNGKDRKKHEPKTKQINIQK